MECTTLSSTDLRVSRIAFGCEPLGGTDWGRVDIPQAIAAVRRAHELGINVFDTADVYGLGRSEQMLSEALGARRHDVIIITKFGVNWQVPDGGGRARTFVDASPKHAVAALHDSLRRLRVDCIPLYLIHAPDSQTPLSSTLEVLQRCREEGKIRYVGVSNFSAQLICEAHGIERLAAAELQYNLIHREAEEEIVPECRELGIDLLAYGPLAQGLLAGKYEESARFGTDDRRSRLPHFQAERISRHLAVVDRLRELGRRFHKTPSQLALRWVLDAPCVACAIVSAKTPAQVEDNVGACGWCLQGDERAYLEGESLG